MRATRFHQHGGPEVLSHEEIDDPIAGPGQVVVAIEAIGLNYIDTYHRAGLYPVDLPCTPGMEAAGTVQEVGAGVAVVKPGDRVGYAGILGSYAELAAVDAQRLIPLPSEVTTETGAAVLLQGMTAHYLAHGSFPLNSEHTALIHAAAGGVGLLLIQMAKRRGARVLGTVSTEVKEALARGAGADEVIRYTEVDFETEVMRLTEGNGVDVVYDSVGLSTFEKGLNVLKPLGYMVLFGQSSGPVKPFDPGVLSVKGSLFVTRPTMVNYVSSRADLLSRASDVLDWIGSGEMNLRIGDRFGLAEVADAHRALQARKTTGKVIILP